MQHQRTMIYNYPPSTHFDVNRTFQDIYQALPPLFSDGSKVIHGIMAKKGGQPGDKASAVGARLLKASQNQRGWSTP